MKCSIKGTGMVPIVGQLAPVFDCDLSELQMLKMLNFPKFSVYQKSSGLLVTKSNYKSLFNKEVSNPEPVEIVEIAPEVSTEETIDEPVVETEAESEPVVETEAEAESVVETETEAEVEDTTDEVVDEEVTEPAKNVVTYNNKKAKNKR